MNCKGEGACEHSAAFAVEVWRKHALAESTAAAVASLTTDPVPAGTVGSRLDNMESLL